MWSLGAPTLCANLKNIQLLLTPASLLAMLGIMSSPLMTVRQISSLLCMRLLLDMIVYVIFMRQGRLVVVMHVEELCVH